MEQRKQARVARLGMAASVATAFGASICCIGPIVAVMFGMTSLATLSKYEPLRPIFGAATAGLLAVAFYATYRKPRRSARPAPSARRRESIACRRSTASRCGLPPSSH
jgi:hypothetical protein